MCGIAGIAGGVTLKFPNQLAVRPFGGCLFFRAGMKS